MAIVMASFFFFLALVFLSGRGFRDNVATYRRYFCRRSLIRNKPWIEIYLSYYEQLGNVILGAK
jgi:hypothetical protein